SCLNRSYFSWLTFWRLPEAMATTARAGRIPFSPSSICQRGQAPASLCASASCQLDASAVVVLEQFANARMRYYNQDRRHSVLNNKPPWQVLERRLTTGEEGRLSPEPASRITLKPEK